MHPLSGRATRASHVLLALALAGSTAAGSDSPSSGDGPPATPGAALLAWGDVDGDGRSDVLALDGERPTVFVQGRGGAFQEVGGTGLESLPPPRSARFADFDGDGLADLLVVLPGPSLRLLRNTGALAFDDVTDAQGLAGAAGAHHAEWIELDRDGHPDLLVVAPGGAAAYRNLAGAGFERLELPAVPRVAAAPGTGPSRGAPAPTDPAAGAAREAVDRGGRSAVPRGSGGGAAAPSIGRGEGSGPVLPSTPLGPRRDASYAKQAEGECAGSLKDQAGSACLAASTSPLLGALYPLSEELFVHADGSVGVGTTEPVGDLHVLGSAIRGELVVSPDRTLSGGRAELVLAGESSGADAVVQRFDGYAKRYDVIGSVGGVLGAAALSVEAASGEVGVGTTSPVERLHVAGDHDLGRLLISPDYSSANADAELMLGEAHGGAVGMSLFYDGAANRLEVRGHSFYAPGTAHLVVARDTGHVGIGTASPEAPLDVAGVVRAGALEVVAGADLVEGFATSDGEPPPGSVLVIDPDRPGRLRRSHRAYDRRVAGVVSGAGGVRHGLRLGQPGLDGDVLVAMTGRVWVRATADGGPIRPGDRLTTSGRSGRAMRVADDAGERAAGAVLGKAMTALESGDGLVLALVNLQ